MRTTLIYLAFLALSSTQIFGQSSRKSPWHLVYSDNSFGLTLEVQFKQLKDSCGDGSTPTHSFVYKLTNSQQCNFLVTWKMDYLDCDGNAYCQERTIDLSKHDNERIEDPDYLFTTSKVINPCYDGRRTNTRIESNKRVVLNQSFPPTGIAGATNVKPGTPVELEVKGGLLGKDSKWVWYTSTCGGQQIDTGYKITVLPFDTTVYFVRAEGPSGNTSCATATVTVDVTSAKPSRISGMDTICAGGSTVLEPVGGSLGHGAIWRWYENDPKTTFVFEGEEFKVSPKSTTIYFVKAVNPKHPNAMPTDPVSFTVNVMNEIEADAITDVMIVDGSDRICEGGSVKLQVQGEPLPLSANWIWRKGSGTAAVLSKGETITVSPKTTATYFVSARGFCNESNADSIRVVVDELSVKPNGIGKSSSSMAKDKLTLKPIGGKKGTDGLWEWYKNDSKGALFSDDDFIVINPNKEAKYFLRAKSKCNVTPFDSVEFKKTKLHQWDPSYIKRNDTRDIIRNNKFLELGFGLGLESYQQGAVAGLFIRPASGQSVIVDSVSVKMSGIGFKGELPFHPFIKEYFSAGFIPEFAIGVSPDEVFQNPNSDEDISYSYRRFALRTELAAGSAPVKLLFGINRSSQKARYENVVNDSTYSFEGWINARQLMMGLRLGRYGTKKPRVSHASNIDLVYTLRNESRDPLGGSWDNWLTGGGFSWWKHSVFRMQFEVLLPSEHASVLAGDLDFKGAYYRFSFVFNGNWFY